MGAVVARSRLNQIEYTRTDFTRTGERYDLILDAVGNLSTTGYKRALTPAGRAVVADFTTLSWMLFQVALLGSITSKTSKCTIKSMLATVKREDLTTMAHLLKQGRVKFVIDRCYPLADTPTALAYLEEGHARGEVVVNVWPAQHP